MENLQQRSTFKTLENVDFCEKINQEISIHMVNLSSGSKNEEKCKIRGEVKSSSTKSSG